MSRELLTLTTIHQLLNNIFYISTKTPHISPACLKLLKAHAQINYFLINISWNLSRSSRLQMLFKVGILKSFAIVTGKRLRWSLYFIKKRHQHRCFTVNITIIFKNSFFVEHLRWLLLSILLNSHHIHIYEMKAVLVIRFAFCVLPALYIKKSKS